MSNYGSGSVTPITIATNTPGSAIAVGSPYGIAITPNGQTAYVTDYASGTVTPITIATNTTGTPITVGSSPYAVAITPDGQTAYVDNRLSGNVTPITIATNTPGTPITVGIGPYNLAITPDQAPTASFTVTPASPGSPIAFDGSASGSPVGSITNYAWTFGDGAITNTTTSTTTHTYATAGPFTASLSVTDSAGTSTTQVFTGQTVSNDGGPSAVTTRTFTLPLGISGLAPTTGAVGGGTVVTITGSGFSPGVASTMFGSTAATAVRCSSATTCIATAPAESAGTVDVTLTSLGVTSTIASSDRFTFGAGPLVSGVNASAGPAAGGQSVAVMGTGLCEPDLGNFRGHSSHDRL